MWCAWRSGLCSRSAPTCGRCPHQSCPWPPGTGLRRSSCPLAPPGNRYPPDVRASPPPPVQINNNGASVGIPSPLRVNRSDTTVVRQPLLSHPPLNPCWPSRSCCSKSASLLSAWLRCRRASVPCPKIPLHACYVPSEIGAPCCELQAYWSCRTQLIRGSNSR